MLNRETLTFWKATSLALVCEECVNPFAVLPSIGPS